MDFLLQLLDFFRHLDAHLADLIRDHGRWIYGILFAIIFCETGLVVTPILPGDSLLFAAGALAAKGQMNIALLWLMLVVAAVAGDNMNYWIGHHVGLRVFKDDARILKTSYLRRTEAFFEKYGGKTVVLARFMPIVRTYAPFVAGASRMPYSRYLMYSVSGGVLWISIFLMGGFFFGNIPFVQEHFEWVVILVIVISVLPAVFEFIKHRRRGASST
jgi:membrane-associated protein